MADRTSSRYRCAHATARSARASASGSRARLASATSASAAGRNRSGSAATSSWARRARIKRSPGGSVLVKRRSHFPGKVRRPWVFPHLRRIGETVPFDENIQGDPFRGDFPGRAEHQPWDELEAGLQRQITELAQRRFQPAIRHQLSQLQRRRREPDSGQPASVTQFDILPAGVGPDTLLARGEILITGRDYDGRPGAAGGRPDRTAKAFLDVLGMQAAEVGCAELEGRVVRLTHHDMEPEELSDVVKALRARGFAASVSNIIPTGPVAKAIGGPLLIDPAGPYEPDAGPGAAAQVAVIDTGIAAEIRADGWLSRVPRDAGNTDPLRVFPLSAPDDPLDLDAGHGTFVSGIVQQIAPGAEITVYRAVDSDGIASEVTVACEMIRAVQEGGAQIVNLSLGGHTLDNVPPVALQA